MGRKWNERSSFAVTSSILFKSELRELDCITGLLNFLLKRWQLKNSLQRFIQRSNLNVSEDLLVNIFS